MQRRKGRSHAPDWGLAGNGLALDERILADIQDGICVIDTGMTVRKVNPTMERWYAHRVPLVGRKCFEVYHGRKRPCADCPSRRALETGEVACKVAPMLGNGPHRNGWIELFAFPLTGDEGKITGVIEYVRDITARRRAEEALRESEERYRALFDQAAESILLIDPLSLRVVEFNERAHVTLNYGRQEFSALRLTRLVPEEDIGQIAAHIRAALELGEQSFEARVRTREGAVRNVRARCRAVTIRERRFVLCIWHDVTDLKRHQDKLETLTLTDELTGLHNRRGFMALAEQQLKLARRSRRVVALIFVDVDGMKRVNDRLGHAAGDRLLQSVAGVLRATFRESDVLARLGGDEFAALSFLRNESDASRHLGRRLAQNLRAANRGRPAGERIAISSGTALWNPRVPVGLSDLLAAADKAMYGVKRRKAARA
jgi:diguanylate cyclase (GGDEF)-like protein/PAS domain S-box-containing protein